MPANPSSRCAGTTPELKANAGLRRHEASPILGARESERGLGLKSFREVL
jgi:hypothetical protein